MKAQQVKTKTKTRAGKVSGRDVSGRDAKTGKFANARAAAVKERASAVVAEKNTLDRYEMRIEGDRLSNWKRAQALSGFSTLKDYLIHLVDKEAETVISQNEKMTLRNDVFDMFVEACDNASKPNDKLKAAANFTKEQGF